MFCIMFTSMFHPAGVYPARARLMSWHPPQTATKVSLPGPSGKSCGGACACVANAAQSKAAVSMGKDNLLNTNTSFDGRIFETRLTKPPLSAGLRIRRGRLQGDYFLQP